MVLIMWEIFDPACGAAVLTTRFKWYARFFSWASGLDYALVGQGWV